MEDNRSGNQMHRELSVWEKYFDVDLLEASMAEDKNGTNNNHSIKTPVDMHATILHMYKQGVPYSEIRKKLNGASDKKIEQLIGIYCKEEANLQRRLNIELRKKYIKPSDDNKYTESFFSAMTVATDMDDLSRRLTKTISKYGKTEELTRTEIKVIQNIIDICVSYFQTDAFFMRNPPEDRIRSFLNEMSRMTNPILYAYEKSNEYGSVSGFSPKLAALYQQKEAGEIRETIKKYLRLEENVFPKEGIDTRELYSCPEELQKKMIAHKTALENSNIKASLSFFSNSSRITNMMEDIDKFIEGYKPHALIEYLDKYIIGQDEAKKIASVTLYTHVCRIKHPDKIRKHNAMIFGPSGSGKTEIWRVLSRISPVPIIIRDAGEITSRGFSGVDFSAMVKRVFTSNPLASFGLIVLDEFDKCAAPKFGREGGNVGHEQQASFLKALEDGVIMDDNGAALDMQLVTFILLGVFEGMKVETHNAIGFNSETLSTGSSKIIDGFVSYGVLPELLRRITFFAELKKLTPSDYISILNNEDISPINMMESQYLTVDNVHLKVNEDAKEAVANYAYDTGLGASEMTGILQSVGWSKYIKALKDGYQIVKITKEDIEKEKMKR